MGTVLNAYVRDWAAPPAALSLAVMSASVIVGVGWVLAVVLLRRLDATPVPGFASGFPQRFTRSLARVGWQSLALAVVALSSNALNILDLWMGSWVVIFSTITVLMLSAVRCVQILGPLLRLVFRA